MSNSSLIKALLFVLLLPLTGCLVVKSDLAKLDEHSGALTLEIDTTSEAEGDSVEESASEPEVDPEKLAAQQEKVEELEHKVAEMEMDLHIAELERELSHEALNHRFEELRRAIEEAEHEMHMFHDFDRPTREYQSRRSVVFAETRLKDSRTELEQLEMLYAGSELEDGTAELVLQRGRMSLARAEEALQQTRREHQVEMEVRIPRSEAQLQRSIERANRDLERAETEKEISSIQEERKFDKMQRELDEQMEELEKAIHDLRNMTGVEEHSSPVAWGIF